MDFLQQLFLEDPFWLAGFCFLLFAAVLFARRRWSGSAARYALPGLLVCAVLLFVAQQAVVTERERILQSLDGLVAALAHKDAKTIAGCFSRRYSSEELDHEAILEFIDSALKTLDVYDTRYRLREISVRGDQAAMVLVAEATVRSHGSPGEYHTSRWQVSWAKEVQGWKIIAIQPEWIDSAPINSMSQLKLYLR